MRESIWSHKESDGAIRTVFEETDFDMSGIRLEKTSGQISRTRERIEISRRRMAESRLAMENVQSGSYRDWMHR